MNDDTVTRSSSGQPKSGLASKIVAGVVLLLIVSVGGFFGGISYEKGRTSSTGTTVASGQAGGGFAGGTRPRDFSGGAGTVSAISSSSITITSQQSATAKTYSITSSTVITDNGSTVTFSDIQIGDMVFVTTSSSSSTLAARIIVNPSFGGANGTPPTGSTNPTTQSQ